MASTIIKTDLWFKYLLVCPRCQGPLEDRLIEGNPFLQCSNVDCSKQYPIYNQVPILIDDERSIFSIQGILSDQNTFFSGSDEKERSVKKYIRQRVLPSLGGDLISDKLLRGLVKALEHFEKPIILVVGKGSDDNYLRPLWAVPNSRLLTSDVVSGFGSDIVCDSHALPLGRASVDCLVITHVLEHVLDPALAVDEVWRVLKPGGYVYSVIPFVFPLHAPLHDFQRFTNLGHRLLFKDFALVDLQVQMGTGSALAYMAQAFILQYILNRYLRWVLAGCARLLFFWLKYFDWMAKEELRKAACGSTVFVGRKLQEKRSRVECYREYASEKVI